MTVFISGGVKNGKSFHAQRSAKILADGGALYYIATMIPHDSEDDARIARHLREREGWGFQTIECPVNIMDCTKKGDVNGAFLLDSVTALLANEMFRSDGSFDANAPVRVANELKEFAKSVKNAIFVSDFIFSDAGHYDEYSEAYRRGLALCDRALCEVCDSVLEICSGTVTVHKGEAI